MRSASSVEMALVPAANLGNSNTAHKHTSTRKPRRPARRESGEVTAAAAAGVMQHHSSPACMRAARAGARGGVSPPMGPFHSTVLQSDSALLMRALLSGPTSRPCKRPYSLATVPIAMLRRLLPSWWGRHRV